MDRALQAHVGTIKRGLVWRLKNLLKCSSGSTAMMLSIALPALIGVVGIAADFAVFNLKQTTMQSAADQAAIAGAKELVLAGSSNSTVEDVASQFAVLALEKQSKDLTVVAKVVDDNKAVSVRLTENWTPFFAHFIDARMTPIVVKAKAELAGESNVCVLALDESAGKTLHMDNNSRLKANNCGVYSNSMNSQGIRLDADSTLKASLVCSAGGVAYKGGAVEPTATEDCPQIADPLASRPAPKIDRCIANQLKITKGTHVLSPGNYCKGLTISGDAIVTFESGSYVISDGRFTIENNARVKGENVGFYLTGNRATLDFTGNSTINLTGAKEGEMSGLLFFEDRDSAKNRVHRINSAHAEVLTGTIYLARGSLRFDPNSSVAAQSDYTALIVQKLLLAEGPELVLNSNYDGTNVPVPEGLRIAAGVVLSE